MGAAAGVRADQHPAGQLGGGQPGLLQREPQIVVGDEVAWFLPAGRRLVYAADGLSTGHRAAYYGEGDGPVLVPPASGRPDRGRRRGDRGRVATIPAADS